MSNLRNIKDTVFTTLFKDKEKVLELYRVLCPEDTTVTVDDIEIVTIERVLSTGLKNDLCFTVRKKKIIFVEAQSSYNPNMPFRLLFYYSEVMKFLILGDEHGSGAKVNIYGEQRVKLPSPEFYVIYTGKRQSEEILSLNDLFVMPTSSKLNLETKVLWTGNDEGDIISQYICFCNIANDTIAEHTKDIESKATNYKDALKKAAEETVETCIQKDVLKEFMIKRKDELISMLDILFSEEYERNMREKYLVDTAEARGETRAFEAVPNILDEVLDGLSDDYISSKYNIDVKSVQQIRARMNR